MIYSKQYCDYFPKIWTLQEFNSQFDLLMDHDAYIKTTEDGFVQISLIEKIYQCVKTFFGGTDYSQRERVQAAWLKFLYDGETQKFITERHIQRLNNRINSSLHEFDPIIKTLMKKLTNLHSSAHDLRTEQLSHLKNIVREYHLKNSSILSPGFWRSLFTSPLISTQRFVFQKNLPSFFSHLTNISFLEANGNFEQLLELSQESSLSTDDWHTSQECALRCYQKRVNLIKNQFLAPNNEGKRKEDPHLFANLLARIGLIYLMRQPRCWDKSFPEKAIEHLEQATNFDPERYNRWLFEAYINAAQIEKEKMWGDKRKAIFYYQKAFENTPENGDYLEKLLQLCLENQQQKTALIIYKKIKEMPWANELNLSAETYNGLATTFFRENNDKEALDCIENAYHLKPGNLQYKKRYFELNRDIAKRNFQKLKNLCIKEESSIQKIVEIAEKLETCWSAGACTIHSLQQSYRDTLVEIYCHLADCYVQYCRLPYPKNQLSTQEIKAHNIKYKKEFQQAIDCYDKALRFQPDHAPLHFDKGVLLDWIVDFDQAMTEFALAVKYQPCNPFYQKLLASFYMVIVMDSQKKTQHNALAAQYASPTFEEDYATWNRQCMYQKRPSINPHAYTQKEGWW